MEASSESRAEEPLLVETAAEPTPPSEDRIAALDLIRGIAILGILPANMPAYSAPTEGMAPAQPLVQWWGDHVVAAAVLFFISAKMFTQLAVLFGVGLALQGDRADAAGRRFAGYYLWRMFLLLLIGLAHGLLLWWGDILASYALIGMVALLFRRLGQRALFWCAVGFLTLTYLLLFSFPIIIALVGTGAREAGPGDTSAVAPYVGAANEERIYRQGPWVDMVINRAIHLAQYFTYFPVWVAWDVLGCFLLGMYLLRRGVFYDPAAHRTFLRRLAVVGLAVGVPLHLAAVAAYAWDPLNRFSMFLNMAGALPQALAYLTLALLWSHSTFAVGLQTRLRAAGRMALTNYLLQSVICGFLFYGYGLGLFGKLGHSAGLAVVVGIWLLELAWSPLWLRHFAMGPVEWLWRSLADRRWRPFRRVAAA